MAAFYTVDYVFNPAERLLSITVSTATAPADTTDVLRLMLFNGATTYAGVCRINDLGELSDVVPASGPYRASSADLTCAPSALLDTLAGVSAGLKELQAEVDAAATGIVAGSFTTAT